jgi:UDP-N-acetylmuramoylalanine--D-glutamate ligase
LHILAFYGIIDPMTDTPKSKPKKQQKIAIIGFSREGQSILKFIKTAKQYRNAEITVLDKNPEIKVPRGVKAITGPDYLNHVQNFHVIFRSPGVPFMRPEIQRAIKNNRVCSSATALFFEELRSMKKRPIIVGVTGTKGKGTTSTLIYECLKQSKVNVVLAGNMGKPMLDHLAAAKKAKVVILELSSFQLQDLKYSPDIAVVLSVTPDHMDAHQSLIEYYTAKAQIAAHQDRNATLFYLPDNIPSSEIARQSLGKKSLIDPDQFTLFKQSDLKLRGKHNFANAVMAATVARALNCSDENIIKAVKKFKGLPYRLAHSHTAKVSPTTAIHFYNDSIGTNPETAAAAVKSFTEPIVLLAGGKDKRLDYGTLRNALFRSPVFAVVLFGENRDKIAAGLHGLPIQIELKTNFEAAITSAALLAKKKTIESSTDTIVLFSPAAASFDMFKSMYDRGEQFDLIVKKTKI